MGDVDHLNNNDGARWEKFDVSYEFLECMKAYRDCNDTWESMVGRDYDEEG